MEALVAARDDEHRRWLGNNPIEQVVANPPSFVIAVDGEPVGFIDGDTRLPELGTSEVNVGYALASTHRGRGYATRALRLMVSQLQGTAVMYIEPENHASRGVARRGGFGDGTPLTFHDKPNLRFARTPPPRVYSDGTVTIRPLRLDDATGNIAAIDDEQIRWLWLPGQRESWMAMDAEARLAHTRRWMSDTIAEHGRGPKHSFAIEVDGTYVGHVDCDLANEHVPAGEANISYSSHPAHRGRGYVSRSVRLIVRFIGDHTGASEAHIGVDAENVASLRVAHAVGAVEADRYPDAWGRPVIRHVLSLRD